LEPELPAELTASRQLQCLHTINRRGAEQGKLRREEPNKEEL